MKLWLASRSETRRRMLEAAGLTLEITSSNLDEEAAKQELLQVTPDPRSLADQLAEMKARGASAPADALVLGADQVLERDDGSMLSKATSRDEAYAQLRTLSGRTHRLHSAAVLVSGSRRCWGFTQSATLTMRRLSDAFLSDYLDREYEAVKDSVGCYRIEGPGVQLFESIEGSHFAILGLPLLPLLTWLRDQGHLPA